MDILTCKPDSPGPDASFSTNDLISYEFVSGYWFSTLAVPIPQDMILEDNSCRVVIFPPTNTQDETATFMEENELALIEISAEVLNFNDSQVKSKNVVSTRPPDSEVACAGQSAQISSNLSQRRIPHCSGMRRSLDRLFQ